MTEQKNETNYLSEALYDVLKLANQGALKRARSNIDTDDLVVAIVWQRHSIAAQAILEKVRDYKRVEANLNDFRTGHSSVYRNAVPRNLELHALARNCLDKAIDIASEENKTLVEPEHLLAAIIIDPRTEGSKLLIKLKIELPNLLVELKKMATNLSKQNSEKTGSTSSELDKYTTDFTELARQGKLDPVFGRDSEIKQVIDILARRRKNNPILLGEAGVGKTAILHGLALSIAANEVPEALLNCRLLSLDVTAVTQGTIYRGMFEERLKNIISAVTTAGNIILAIDEVHTMVGAGGSNSDSSDMGNILKTPLANGELRLVGATTIDEYRKHIEKDPALARRMQPVQVNPPGPEQTLAILRGLKKTYEEFHNLAIEDAALVAAVRLAEQYIQDRHSPDKDIDVIDQGCACLKNTRSSPEQQLVLTELLVAEQVSKISGVPVAKLTKSEKEKLLHLEDSLHKRIIGQNEAVIAVSKAMRRAGVNLRNRNKPIASFIFAGPTGVGKTELAKALAAHMFSEGAMIRLDMSEYMERHTVSKLIGSPPGYVGFDNGGQLTNAVRTKPYSVVLFDEIEKAHPDVFNMLLQILDDGRLTDSKGRTVSFKNTVIIMTTNVGAAQIQRKATKSMGFLLGDSNEANAAEDAYNVIKDLVQGELAKYFRPEFLNRLSGTVVFRQLTKPEVYQIVDILLKDIHKALAEQSLTMSVSNSARELLTEKGFSDKFGARELQRTITELLEDELAVKMLESSFEPGNCVNVDAKDGKLTFDSSPNSCQIKS